MKISRMKRTLVKLYKPIGRDKWLNIRPYKLTEKYHRDEIDKNNREFTEKIFMWCEIIIDRGNPNGRIDENNY